jgi:serine/threonine protein phosphatase 1
MFALKKKTTTDEFIAAAPEGQRLYAVGDIHGRADLLDALLDKIAADAAETELQSRVIFLGDYVDRGPNSKEVLERLLQYGEQFPQSVFLKGNHEEAMLDFIADPIDLESWIDWGGLETMQSYGLPAVADRPPESLRNELVEKLPDAHFQFLMDLPCYYQAGDYIFVHAGLRAGVSLGNQVSQDMLWIRDEFYLTSASDWGSRCIVHGHTPQNAPFNSSWRVNVDTGAFRTGSLTAVVLEGKERRFIQS